MQEFKTLNLGLTEYKKALKIQFDLLEKRRNDFISDTLILVEHPPTITIGRGGNLNNLLVSEEHLKNNGIHFEQISRGGDITFHGPGQIVGYPIVDLNRLGKDIHRYLRSLEYLIVDVLKNYDIKSSAFKCITGVWAGGKKIASIGIGVKRWITYHGFALNIYNDLDYFDMIIPCGLNKVRMTNIVNESGLDNITMDNVNNNVIESFAKIFNMKYSGTLDLRVS
ncbi:MAG: lipoyl(octanoyl) transferase LipB [Candidatus Dadabacteria bacterium]|nr:lipoyl(octanoyl) transferase LipB [Candidatus Dadabacteria bacterium]NIS09969.1 lipoyl(octanoyl) transferase LipB [Candidatus Dadabacteria bacterium]NIV42963.1 lipoyl(octanoyl) transferase LipB [Candidatus Dadabacteria bacterium]NIY22944.1 lipoyl(octanoyl) transferase LipB [Candidatus Dadabacteria bacterium]